MIFAQMQAPTWINSALNNPQVFPCELSTPQKEQWFHQIIRYVLLLPWEGVNGGRWEDGGLIVCGVG